jgi:hypothetical protein
MLGCVLDEAIWRPDGWFARPLFAHETSLRSTPDGSACRRCLLPCCHDPGFGSRVLRNFQVTFKEPLI